MILSEVIRNLQALEAQHGGAVEVRTWSPEEPLRIDEIRIDEIPVPPCSCVTGRFTCGVCLAKYTSSPARPTKIVVIE